MTQYKLTRVQEALWVEWKLHPQSITFNTCVKLRLEGSVDVVRFQRAAQDVVAYFDSLHSYFVEENGIPKQCFDTSNVYELPFLDISDGAGQEYHAKRKEAEELLDEIFHKPINLLEFPIVNAALVKSAEDVFYFIGVVPHIISDGYSALLLLEAIACAYNEGAEGLFERYGSQPKGWVDYLGYLQDRYDSDTKEMDKCYWQSQMQNHSHIVDFGRPLCEHKDAFSGKRVAFSLPANQFQKLKCLASSERTSVFSPLVAMFALFIQRYFDQGSYFLGYPVSTRPAGFKHSFGCFVNILPLKVNSKPDITFRGLVQAIHNQRKLDKKHQQLAGVDIVKAKRMIDSEFDGRLFNVAVTQTVSRMGDLVLDGVEACALDTQAIHMNEDLVFAYELDADGAGLWLEYREVLFSKSFIEQAVEHFSVLVAAALSQPDIPIMQLPLYGQEALQQYLVRCAPHKGVFDKLQTVHGLFERQALLSPHAVAVRAEDGVLTYAELSSKANQISHHLIDQGVNVGDRVGVCFGRSGAQLAALLGVMKAGAAYVPLDPDCPQSRLDYIRKDADIAVVIDADFITQSSKCSLHNPNIVLDSSALAYVLYTSGSTGEPKGVMVAHEGVVARLEWMRKAWGVGADDVILQSTVFGFDISVTELFLPLMVGARLVMPKQNGYKDPNYLCHFMAREGVTFAQFVPSALQNFLVASGKTKVSTLATVVALGEVLPRPLVQVFYKVYEGSSLYNGYGPTEATILVSSHLCKADGVGAVPIGRAVDNVGLYVCDSRMRLQPPGVKGELYVSGAGVAKGYWRQQGLTKERFVSNPFGDGLLYKTGDLAYYREDGCLMFCGRNDHQVKLRGFRIELGEIEAALVAHPNVAEAVVLVSKGAADNDRLVAYVVLTCGEETQALQAYIGEKLPQYMVPHFWHVLDAMPRNASGKIDRQELLQNITLQEMPKGFMAPSTSLELMLAAIWAEVLRVPKADIGVHDSFFALGGDSLLAIQVVTLASNQGISLPTEALLHTPTIASLVKQARLVEGKELVKLDMVESGEEGALPLLPRQAKFFAERFVNPHRWGRTMAVAFDFVVDENLLNKAFNYVVNYHEGLRLQFVQVADKGWQAEVAATAERQLVERFAAADDKRELAGIADHLHAQICLHKPPLLKLALVQVSKSKSYLVLAAHHLLLDMMSCRIVLEDVFALYQDVALGKVPSLPAKTASLVDWASLLHSDAKFELFSKERNFWLSQLEWTRLPVDHVNVAALEYDATSQVLECAADDLVALQEGYYPLQDQLLAFVAKAVAAWANVQTVSVAVPSYARHGFVNEIDLSRVVGWVNSVYPLAIDAGLENDALIANVARLQKLVPHQGLGYAMLKYVMQDAALLGKAEPELFFNYVSRIDTALPDNTSVQLIDLPNVVESDPRNLLAYKLYFEAALVDGALQLRVTYSKQLYDTGTIASILDAVKNSITLSQNQTETA